jgi:hypothetical protein
MINETESNWIEPPILPYTTEEISESRSLTKNMVEHRLYNGDVYTIWFDSEGIINWWLNERN